jgi:hypothetical protein
MQPGRRLRKHRLPLAGESRVLSCCPSCKSYGILDSLPLPFLSAQLPLQHSVPERLVRHMPAKPFSSARLVREFRRDRPEGDRQPDCRFTPSLRGSKLRPVAPHSNGSFVSSPLYNNEVNLHLARNVLQAPFSRQRHRKLSDARSLLGEGAGLPPAPPRYKVGQARVRFMCIMVPAPLKTDLHREFWLMISVNGGGRWADLGSGRRWGCQTKGKIEHCPSLDVRRPHRDGLLRHGKSYPSAVPTFVPTLNETEE